MTSLEILRELEALASRLGIEVRCEPFDAGALRAGGKGGLCRLRGRPLIVMDAGLPLLDKIGVLSEALSRFDLAPLYVPPILRGRLERTRPIRRAPVRGPLRPPVKAVRRVDSFE